VARQIGRARVGERGRDIAALGGTRCRERVVVIASRHDAQRGRHNRHASHGRASLPWHACTSPLLRNPCLASWALGSGMLVLVSPVAAYASARISSFSAQLTYGIRASAANRGGRHAKFEIESGSTITLKSSPPYPPSALRQKYAARRGSFRAFM